MADAQRPGASGAQTPSSSGIVSTELHRDDEQSEASRRKGALLFRFKRRTVISAAAAVIVLFGGGLAVSLLTSGGSASDGVVEYTAGHRPLAPDITATSLTGTTIKLSSYRGTILVLNFWGSWCPPCRAEAPALEVAYQQYHPHGVDFLGDDVQDTPANALSFIHSEGIGYPSINDPGYSVVQQFSQAALVSYAPTTVVIDKTGHVVGMVVGRISTGELATLLHQAEAANS
jgi:peroxiredoxin